MTASQSHDAQRWELPSNSGRTRLSGLVVGRHVDASGAQCISTDINIEQAAFTSDGTDREPQLKKESSFRLADVPMGAAQLSSLSETLEQWLREPFEFCQPLTTSSVQRFELGFGVREDFVCSLEKPVCCVTYANGLRSSGEVRFIVDQSCMRILHDGMIRALSG